MRRASRDWSRGAARSAAARSRPAPGSRRSTGRILPSSPLLEAAIHPHPRARLRVGKRRRRFGLSEAEVVTRSTIVANQAASPRCARAACLHAIARPSSRRDLREVAPLHHAYARRGSPPRMRDRLVIVRLVVLRAVSTDELHSLSFCFVCDTPGSVSRCRGSASALAIGGRWARHDHAVGSCVKERGSPERVALLHQVTPEQRQRKRTADDWSTCGT